MKKTLKSIKSKFGVLNEAYAWERTPGKALPTMADVQAKHNAKSVNEQEKQSLTEASILEDLERRVMTLEKLVKTNNK